MEATAAAVTGLAAAPAVPPGAAVPVTTAGAAQRVGASKPRRTHLGLEGPATRRGWGPETWERGVLYPHTATELLGWGWGSTWASGTREELPLGRVTHPRGGIELSSPGSVPIPTPCPPAMPREQRAFVNTGIRSPCPLFCLRPAYQPGAHRLCMAQASTVGCHLT